MTGRYLKISQHCLLAYTARIVSCCDWPFVLPLKESIASGRLGIFLCMRAVCWAAQAPPDPTCNSCHLESHQPNKSQNCTFCVVLELYGCCLNFRIPSCGLWPGWKFTDALIQSSWDPINNNTKEGPLSSSGLQRGAHSNSHSLDCFSEYFANCLGWSPWNSASACRETIQCEVSISLNSMRIFMIVCVCVWTDPKHNVL